jgi:peptidoglycan-associated lipoprotein
MRKTCIFIAGLLMLPVFLSGCPKRAPQPEIDAAETAMAGIEDTKDCAPEAYQAAKTMMDKAKALLKEERYDEAKTALLAAKRLAEKARAECDKKRKEEEERKKKLAAAKPEPTPAAKTVENKKGPADLVTVYFGFNDSNLSDETRRTLAANAEYLRIHSSLRVQVEGHCDERGSTEYNLALGERRAMTTKKYLVKLGIDPGRIEIISYGEERPANPASNEDAWAQNRRAEFLKLK